MQIKNAFFVIALTVGFCFSACSDDEQNETFKDAKLKLISSKSEKEDTDSIYLTQEEIQKIYDLEITEDLLRKNDYKNQNLKTTIKSLNEKRDRFLFGCFTALRHSDYSRLDALFQR